MTPWIEALFVKYQWVWIGLTVGFAAKYALLIKKGVRIRLSLVAADILVLPLVWLLAWEIVTRLGAAGERAALLSALAMVGADRLIKLATDRFFKNVVTDVGQVSDRVRGIVRQEVQTERSGHSIIEDTLSGRAPDEYVALRTQDRPGGKP